VGAALVLGLALMLGTALGEALTLGLALMLGTALGEALTLGLALVVGLVVTCPFTCDTISISFNVCRAKANFILSV